VVDAPTRDPGVARERTELAWNRTGVALLVAAAAILRHLWPLHGDRSVVALALLAAGGTVWIVALWWIRRVRATSPGPLGAPILGLIASGTLLLALAGLVVSLVTPTR
jgi:uncharacterized membrane protein YidH (DUF202 family)